MWANSSSWLAMPVRYQHSASTVRKVGLRLVYKEISREFRGRLA